MIGVMDLEVARAEWAPEGTYLNTASYGLPPARDVNECSFMDEALCGCQPDSAAATRN